MAREKLYKNLALTERMARFISVLGYVKIESRNKYIMFHKKTQLVNGSMGDRFLFLGKNGAVRVNVNCKSVTGSISVTDHYKAYLKAYETKQGIMEKNYADYN